MKTYKNLYSRMLEHDNIVACIKSASKDKTQRPDVKRIMADKDRHADVVRDLIVSGEMDFTNYTTKIINENNGRKIRLITKPRFKYDQIGHHVVMSVFKPIVQKSLYEHVYSTIPKRSSHIQARRTMRKWIDSFGKRRFYVLKCDIRHFYDSVDHDLLKSKLSRVIKDKEYLEVLFRLIDGYSPGIPKGFYSSQWLANFLLSPLDHYIKEDLKAKYYMRFMDDMVILGSNKRKLRKIKEGIERYLKEVLGLEFKDNWQIYRFVDKNDQNGRDIDFMGFRFFRNKTILRKSNLKRIRRKANHLAAKRKKFQEGIGQGTTIHDCHSMLSYIGWTKHADCYGFYQEYIKPKVSKRQLRLRVSRHDKIRAKIKKAEEEAAV